MSWRKSGQRLAEYHRDAASLLMAIQAGGIADITASSRTGRGEELS